MSNDALDALNRLQSVHLSPDSYRPEDVRDHVLGWRSVSAALELTNDRLLLQAAERGRSGNTPPVAWLRQSAHDVPRTVLQDVVSSARAQEAGVVVRTRQEARQAQVLIEAALRDGTPLRQAVEEAQRAVDGREVRRRAAQVSSGTPGLRRLMLPESSSSDIETIQERITRAATVAGVELPDAAPERLALLLRMLAGLPEEAIAAMLPRAAQP